tara:strand:- start:119 stop:436 length:318 start_codon:yes stop_codon:yes gene_type:complete
METRMKIDKNVPVTNSHIGRESKNPEFPELVKKMEPGDSINFPFDEDSETGSIKRYPKDGRRISSTGHRFRNYCMRNGYKVVSRVNETGLRVWLFGKKTTDTEDN